MKQLIILGIASLFVFCAAVAVPGDLNAPQQKQKSSSSQKGWLGVAIQDITPQIEKSMNLRSRDGALVSEVVRKSPAESAGIKKGDVILQFADKTIQETEDLQNAVAETKPESKVSIVFVRKGEKKTIEVVIGKQAERREYAAMPRAFRNLEIITGSSRVQGMTLRELNDQIGQYFGVTEGTGALVWEVEKGSASDKAGIKAGDVITVVGKKKIKELRDVSRALGIYDEGEKADVEVLRKGSRQTLTMEVEENKDDSGSHFWFNAPEQPGRHGEFYFNNAPFQIDLPEINIERIRPDMDRLRTEMDELRSRLRDESSQMREKILREVRPHVTVHFREEI